MKYYVLIQNSLGELSLFAEASSRDEAQRELAPLIAAGFPKTRTKVLRAGSEPSLITQWHLVFTTGNGETQEYSIHTADGRREFLLAAEMICRRQLKTVTAVELQDNIYKTICRAELGNPTAERRAATIRPLPCELNFQPTLKITNYGHKTRF